ncbi:hypothetical protein FHL15_006211 [Xylaria flabelliformis]|uniref:Uncharacterized protein n=1 Tax=Xylaria flabelliformis TaxID=2512241 RepID=A0A553HXX7_9PEZI|nr:hypothetical protein FHL15_006211 [Xylaria flabelliformis]
MDTDPITNRSQQTRSPLSNLANMEIDKTSIWEHKDSSEDPPSTHESIFDAAWLSTSDLAKSPYQTPGRPVTPFRAAIDIDLDSESPLSRLETPFLYGHGTELAPILEQRSIATLRTKGSLSTSDLSSLLHDAPGGGGGDGGRNSSSSNSKSKRSRSKSETSHPLRRQPSFSPPPETTTTTTTITGTNSSSSPQLRRLSFSRPTVHIVDVHAYPRKPIYPAPQRPKTPPSLRRISRPQSEGDAYMMTTTATAMTSSSSSIAYEAPGFRAPRSGHGNLSSHPFIMSQSTTAIPSTTAPSTSSPTRQHQQQQQQQQQRRRNEPQLEQYIPLTTTTTTRRSGGSARHQRETSTGSPDIGYLAPPEARGGTCKKCRHPRGERWSLGSTLVGYGPGMRRGADWCSRCACRKIIRGWCCGNERGA